MSFTDPRRPRPNVWIWDTSPAPSDGLDLARGIVCALAIVTPFWTALAWWLT